MMFMYCIANNRKISVPPSFTLDGERRPFEQEEEESQDDNQEGNEGDLLDPAVVLSYRSLHPLFIFVDMLLHPLRVLLQLLGKNDLGVAPDNLVQLDELVVLSFRLGLDVQLLNIGC